MKTVEKAMTILDVLIKSGESMGVTELANRCEINKTTAYKILSVLVAHGYVRKSRKTAKYDLGYTYVRVGNMMVRRLPIRTLAYPHMKSLNQKTQQTVNLMVLFENQGIYAEVIESPTSRDPEDMIGMTDYLHATALGKAILAFLPLERQRELISLGSLEMVGDNTITQEDALYKELDLTAKRGFAIDYDESARGARCVAAPIFAPGGEVIAAISVSGVSAQTSIDRLFEYSSYVIDEASKITQTAKRQTNSRFPASLDHAL